LDVLNVLENNINVSIIHTLAKRGLRNNLIDWYGLKGISFRISAGYNHIETENRPLIHESELNQGHDSDSFN
jgi:hypothetical protein